MCVFVACVVVVVIVVLPDYVFFVVVGCLFVVILCWLWSATATVGPPSSILNRPMSANC